MKRDAKAKEAVAKLKKPQPKPVSKASMEHIYERRRHP